VIRLIRALIFDFDGTVLDTEGAVYQSYQELYRDHGCKLSLQRWSLGIGTTDNGYDPYTDLEDLLGRKLDRSALRDRQRQREAELIACLPVLPGIEAYLKDARRLGLKVGMASSSSCAWITGHLTRLGLLKYFDSVLGRDDVRRGKPDPELYLDALKDLGVQAGEAIVFEDSPNGILAGRQAGIFTVAVPNPVTRRLPVDGADLRLDSLADLALERLLDIVNTVRSSMDITAKVSL
jgi:HAD superfamily hydrolase (TIGR01509 family)